MILFERGRSGWEDPELRKKRKLGTFKGEGQGHRPRLVQSSSNEEN